MFYLNLWSSWNWVSCGESWKSLLSIFRMFHRTDFGGFLVCCYKAIQQLNGVEKISVAIGLMLNHNLTGLFINYAYIYTWITEDLRETVLKIIITWPALGKKISGKSFSSQVFQLVNSVFYFRCLSTLTNGRKYYNK